MSKRISFFLTNHDGTPLTGETPYVSVYRSIDGTALTIPVVAEKGNGFYEFVVDYETDGPAAYLIDAGANSSERYLHGSIGEAISFAMYDVDGSPTAALVPTFYSYFDESGPLTPPEIMNLTGGLYAFWAPVGSGTLIRYVVDGGANTYWGTIGSTTITNVNPAENTEITNTQAITLDVLDTETELGRVLIAIKYESLGGATELAWDGDAITGPFQITVVPITNGRRYTIVRLGGWPAAPTIRVFITNYGGREI
jgi:hypothetical protein